ncbi:MAG: hypothetical protein AB7S75_22445 [Desulfococcaceae bacterium]
MQDTEDIAGFEDYAGCFGDYNPEDIICRKFCALSIRCIIERDQIDMMELMEDFPVSENMFMTVQ